MDLENYDEEVEVSSQPFRFLIVAGLLVLTIFTALFFTVGAPSLGEVATSNTEPNFTSDSNNSNSEIFNEISLSAFSPKQTKESDDAGVSITSRTNTDIETDINVKASPAENKNEFTEVTSSTTQVASSSTTSGTVAIVNPYPDPVEKIIDGVTYRADAEIVREPERIIFEVEVEDCAGQNLEIFVRTGVEFELFESGDCSVPLSAIKDQLEPDRNYLAKVNLQGELLYYLYLPKPD